MNKEEFVRLIAGSMVLLGSLLGYVFSDWFYIIHVFVGLNLIQSAFTGFCPPSIFYERYLD